MQANSGTSDCIEKTSRDCAEPSGNSMTSW